MGGHYVGSIGLGNMDAMVGGLNIGAGFLYGEKVAGGASVEHCSGGGQ